MSLPHTPQSSSSGAPPPEPLAFTVHHVATPELAAAATRRTLDGRLQMLLVLLACAAPVIASYFSYYVVRPEGRNHHGELIQPSRSLPAALNATTLAGEPVQPRALRGQWLLVSVGPAACGAACEQRLFAQRQLREMLGRDAERIDKLWLVSDGAPIAATLLQALAAPPATTVLRVDAAALAGWLQPAAGQALEDHLYLVDPMGEWMMRFPVVVEPAKVKRDLARLLRASASWDQAGR
jgi:hypothetical protein